MASPHPSKATSSAYSQAGVDIDRAHDLMDRVKERLRAATRPEVLGGIGGFGGLFQLDLSRWREPVLVSSVDGVGTKLMVAAAMNNHSTVGHDIVNHCIDDIAVQGAEPLYFMDYLGIGKLRSPLYEEVLAGLAEACTAQNVALLGGETAEMPGMYGDDYDLVGCIVGVVEKSKLLDGTRVRPGHVAIGLASNGLHTNGYSLARNVLFEQAGYTANTELESLGETVGAALLRPHTCYWPAVQAALRADLPLDGMAHITGGGLYDNVPRVLPEDCDFLYHRGALPVPPVFEVIREKGDIDECEMHRVFNMGVGMVWFAPSAAADALLAAARNAGFQAERIGEIVAGARQTRIEGLDTQ